MGRSTADGLTGNDDVVALLADFIDHLADRPALLLGHSYGAYLARGVAAQRPDAVLGLALLCPIAERSRDVPDHDVVRQDADAYDELEPEQRAGFDEYFVVRTRCDRSPLPRPRRPGHDARRRGRARAHLRRVEGRRRVETFAAPTLIAAGRRDSSVGYADAADLLEHYPHATLAVIDDAGHALMHERPELLAALLGDWLARAC